jgi:hypothetical protein
VTTPDNHLFPFQIVGQFDFMLKQRFTLALLVIPAFCAYSGPANDLTLKKRVQIGAEAVALGCWATGEENNVTMDLGRDGSVILRKLPPELVYEQIQYSRKERADLLTAIQKIIVAHGPTTPKRRLNCMRKYGNRLIDPVLPPSKS